MQIQRISRSLSGGMRFIEQLSLLKSGGEQDAVIKGIEEFNRMGIYKRMSHLIELSTEGIRKEVRRQTKSKASDYVVSTDLLKSMNALRALADADENVSGFVKSEQAKEVVEDITVMIGDFNPEDPYKFVFTAIDGSPFLYGFTYDQERNSFFFALYPKEVMADMPRLLYNVSTRMQHPKELERYDPYIVAM